MQPGNPYHLIEAVGSCQVGSVWSAIDPQGRSLMVALLDSNVATDQRWREAFQEAANALVQAGEPGYLYANFAAGSPWVAYAAENGVGAERVFLALGMDFRPVPPDGLGPVDHTPPEPTTQLTPTPAAAPVQPAAPDTMAQQQPLPPAVIEAATPSEAPPAEAPPTTAPPTTAESTDDAESTQPTQRMEPAPVTPWTNTTPPQAGPVSAPPVVAVPPQPTSGVPGPTSGIPHPTSGVPRPTSGVPRPTSGVPQSGAPWPVSGAPMSPAFSQPLSPAYGAPAYGPRPPQGPAPYDPYAPAAPPPRRSRTGLWIGIAVAVLVLIAGGGGVYAWSAAGDDPTPLEVTASATTVPLPTSTARSPGIEPPQDATWNASWPKFGSADRVRQLNLEGVGFAFSVPDNWDCVRGGGGEGAAEYDCGPTPGGGQEFGGELIVRDCPKPCNGDRRAAMRKAEEAWGLRWQRTSPLAAYAETNQIDGQPRYGLVIVAYWRSTPNEALDRQLVFRMTAPVDQADVLRKISNSVRSGARF